MPAVSKVLKEIFSLLRPPAILQYDNGSVFKNQEKLLKCGKIKNFNGKPGHSQSQWSVERANRDVENLLACWQAENNFPNWSKALNIIQLQKNSKWHKGNTREPYIALFGQQPAFGLKSLNIPDEVIDGL